MICDRYGPLSGEFLRAVPCCRESAWLQVSVEPSRRICRSPWRWNPPTLLYFLLLHLLGFRWTRNRPQGWRSRCERGHANKGGGEKLVKDRVHLAREDPLDKNRESRSSMSDPMIRRDRVRISKTTQRSST